MLRTAFAVQSQPAGADAPVLMGWKPSARGGCSKSRRFISSGPLRIPRQDNVGGARAVQSFACRIRFGSATVWNPRLVSRLYVRCGTLLAFFVTAAEAL